MHLFDKKVVILSYLPTKSAVSCIRKVSYFTIHSKKIAKIDTDFKSKRIILSVKMKEIVK
ncbi:hypothetical protein CWR48_00735 [Oceanobacillus arenosus]|uniref:Uncharacterized protein n=1 Tax=Oceanobacillus arenosus TaxID=1229153 RepID=A0A3D8Q1F2_9BACI|nr:hypothetical protein CWR48_00735 [Oceanobacillus arenosus]